MSFGTYGSVKQATVQTQDMDVMYCYSETRNDFDNKNWQTLDASQIIEPTYEPDNANRQVSGVYNFTFPTSVFNEKGFYYIYVRPKKFDATILDCGILSASGIKGIVIDTKAGNAYSQGYMVNNGLVGFKLEYVSIDGSITDSIEPNFFNVVSSANLVEAVTENLNNDSTKAVRYRLNDNGSLLFLTLVNSSSNNVKPNVLPYLGRANQKVIMSNTFFDAKLIELEMCTHNFDTLANALYGSRVTDCTSGKVTMFDQNGDIYKQFNNYTIKDDSNSPKYNIFEEVSNIDFTQTLNNILNQ